MLGGVVMSTGQGQRVDKDLKRILLRLSEKGIEDQIYLEIVVDLSNSFLWFRWLK